MLARLLIVLLEHDLFLDSVNVLLAGTHAANQGVILLLKVLAALLDLVILERQLHQLPLRVTLTLVRCRGILLVLVDALLKFTSPRLVTTILFMYLGDLSNVPLANVLVLLDLLFDFGFVFVDAVLEGLTLISGAIEITIQTSLGTLPLADLTIELLDFLAVLLQEQILTLLQRFNLERHLLDCLFFVLHLMLM